MGDRRGENRREQQEQRPVRAGGNQD